jgi:branched-subunit amino acid aminotransferase/4-amino-4-deoxychorismate lyase
MVALFESIRIEEYGNAVLVYNSERHAKRIFNSAKELGL